MSDNKNIDTKKDLNDVNLIYSAEPVTHRKINLDNNKDTSQNSNKFIFTDRKSNDSKAMTFLYSEFIKK